MMTEKSGPFCSACLRKQTYFHVGLERWTNRNAEIWDLIQTNFPTTAPVNLGHIGYDGQSGQFISLEVMQRAYRATGLALEFYRSYDAAWNDPGVHFDRITAVDSSQLKPCNETMLSESSIMQKYAELTGDWDGVEEVDGKVRGKCFSEHFWFPPPCRADATKCFLFITALGYEFEVTMQRATIFNMPIVPVDAKDWDTYARLPKTVTSLFFWWQPDPTFLGLNAKMVSFPSFNRTDFARGLVTSASTGIQLEAWLLIAAVPRGTYLSDPGLPHVCYLSGYHVDRVCAAAICQQCSPNKSLRPDYPRYAQGHSNS